MLLDSGRGFHAGRDVDDVRSNLMEMLRRGGLGAVRARGLALTEENPLTDLAELNVALVACAQQGRLAELL